MTARAMTDEPMRFGIFLPPMHVAGLNPHLAIIRLFRGETVTEKTDWYTCQDAVLQLTPYSDFDIAVASTISPSGSKLAGRYGLGLLSIAATNPEGGEMLGGHWQVMTEQAAKYGTTVDRRKWRMMGPMHIAESVEQAKANCRYGLRWVFDYLSHVVPTSGPPPEDYDAFVDGINASRSGVIGTPDMAIELIEGLIEKSGGFGTYLMMGADFADWRATVRHYELFAEHVMPHFNGQLGPVMDSYGLVMNAGDRYVTATINAQMASIERYAHERAQPRS